MAGRRRLIREAEDGLFAPLCGRHGSFGNRRSDGNEGRNGQNTPFSGGAGGETRTGGRKMNRHLSKEQISKYLIGDGSPQETQHVGKCAACSAELARLESSLSQFRSSVRHWSDRVSHAGYATPWNAPYEGHEIGRASCRE